jgi:hydrogenase small subunit
MSVSRRELLKASSALAAALGLRAIGADKVFAAGGDPPVVWLQAQGCTGCSISLLNSLTAGASEDLLREKIDLKFHPTLMAAAGPNAVAAATAARDAGGYVLVVEGAIPTGAEGHYCYLWPGTTALEGVRAFAAKAKHVVAVGTCAAFGGISGSVPAGGVNPTGAKGVSAVLGGTTVVNVSGCPPHPDWIVLTIASLLRGAVPARDASGRPRACYPDTVHEQCPYERGEAEDYCLEDYGCKGPVTYSNCPVLKWNSPTPGAKGVNWCMGAGSPCQGCTQPNFPDGMLPFHARVERRRGKQGFRS